MSNNNEDDDFQVHDGEDPSEDSVNDEASSSSSSKKAATPDRRAASSRSSSRRQGKSSSPFLLFQKTRIREYLTPYLPPPVIQAIHRLDPQLEPWVGPEACVTLVGTLLVAWIVLALMRTIFLSTINSTRSGRRAVADDDDDDQVLSSSKGASGAASAADNQYDATVLLCGPRHGGKTCLFYQLGLGVSELLPTVTSIKANVAVSNCKPFYKKMNSSSDDKENENSSPLPRIRYVDWPGHAPLNDPVLEKSVWNKASTTTTTTSTTHNHDALRIVLVLDATQPVAAAAETLYELWSRAAQNGKKAQRQKQNLLSIFCACHKKDLAKAKNSMRIKIQMRTELQRILSVQKPAWWASMTLSENGNNNNATDAALDLNDLPYCKLHFASTSSSSVSISTNSSQQQHQEPGMVELATFCQTGQLPSQES